MKVQFDNISSLFSKIVCTAFILFAYQSNIRAQLSAGGKPPSFQQNLPSNIPTTTMPFIDNDSLLQIDSINQINNQNGPFQYGYPINVDVGINNTGKWDTLGNGDRIWRMMIASTGAKSINLIYNSFSLPQGALFYVYNKDKTHILGAFTYINNKSYNKFSTGIVKGDTIILELYEPFVVMGTSLLNVSRVIHGYRNTAFQGCPGPGCSGNCNIDVNCPPGLDWCIEMRSVVIILTGAGALCTGAMINNVNEDLTPYLLTANHCIVGQDVNTLTFIYRFWDIDCDNVVEGPVFQPGISGAITRANNAASDFALLELSITPFSGMGAYYAGWDNAFNAPQSGAYIHHPSGDLMKISTYNQTAQAVTSTIQSTNIEEWRIILSDGVVEGGSSGAPLFNQNRLIVGQHRLEILQIF